MPAAAAHAFFEGTWNTPSKSPDLADSTASQERHATTTSDGLNRETTGRKHENGAAALLLLRWGLSNSLPRFMALSPPAKHHLSKFYTTAPHTAASPRLPVLVQTSRAHNEKYTRAGAVESPRWEWRRRIESTETGKRVYGEGWRDSGREG